MRTVQAFILCFVAAAVFLPALSASAADGAITVINDTEFTLEIKVDGQTRCKLAPGAKKTLDAIPEGAHQLQAVTPDGDVKFSKEMRVIAGRTASWYLKWTHLLPGPQVGIYLIA